jgi:hypothetical protein
MATRNALAAAYQASLAADTAYSEALRCKHEEV